MDANVDQQTKELFKILSTLIKGSKEYRDIRNQIVQLYIDIIPSFIKTKCGDLEHYSYEDLYQNCIIWLIEAVENFSYTKIKNINTNATSVFLNFAFNNMILHLKDTLDECDNQVESLDEIYEDEEDGYLCDKSAVDCIVFGIVKDDEYDPYEILENIELKRSIIKAIENAHFNERCKGILKMYYGDNSSYRKIAEYYNLSVERIRQIDIKCIHILRHPKYCKLFVDWKDRLGGYSYSEVRKEEEERKKEERRMAKVEKAAKEFEEKMKAVPDETNPNCADDNEFIEFLKNRGEKLCKPKKDIAEDIVDESIESVKASRRLTRMRMNEKKSDMEKIARNIGVTNPALALAMQAQMHLDNSQIDKLTTMIENEDVFITQDEFINFYVKPMLKYLNNVILKDYRDLEVKLFNNRTNKAFTL